MIQISFSSSFKRSFKKHIAKQYCPVKFKFSNGEIPHFIRNDIERLFSVRRRGLLLRSAQK